MIDREPQPFDTGELHMLCIAAAREVGLATQRGIPLRVHAPYLNCDEDAIAYSHFSEKSL